MFRKRKELLRELENKKIIISMQSEQIIKLNTQLYQERTLRKQAEHKLSNRSPKHIAGRP